MKATLNGIVYDTDTAERLADVTHILDLFTDGARQYIQSVYRNRDGRYFLRVETSDDDYVVPLTGAEADAYLYKYGRKKNMNATKNELQHNTMLHYYLGTTVNGAKTIAHKVEANPLWIVAMLVMAWLAYSVQDMRATESMGSIGHLMTVLQSIEMLAVAAIALVVVCYRIGSVTGAKQMYQDLLRGGIVNSAGEAPLLVERKRIDGKQENCLLTFKIKGLPLERWKDLSPTIAASLGVYVVEIKEGAEPYTYTVHTVANDALPTRIDWSPSIIPDRPTKFALGEAVTGTVYADIRNDPGILTASATGGGKTMETKGIAAQALCRDYILIVADYKYVEYGGIWGSKGTYIVHDDENLLWVMQRLIERLHDRRDWLAEHDCRNIDDYNERYPDNKLRRVMLLIDEAAIALDTRTQNKAKKGGKAGNRRGG